MSVAEYLRALYALFLHLQLWPVITKPSYKASPLALVSSKDLWVNPYLTRSFNSSTYLKYNKHVKKKKRALVISMGKMELLISRKIRIEMFCMKIVYFECLYRESQGISYIEILTPFALNAKYIFYTSMLQMINDKAKKAINNCFQSIIRGATLQRIIIISQLDSISIAYIHYIRTKSVIRE